MNQIKCELPALLNMACFLLYLRHWVSPRADGGRLFRWGFFWSRNPDESIIHSEYSSLNSFTSLRTSKPFFFLFSFFNQLFFQNKLGQVATKNNPGVVQIRSPKASSQDKPLGAWAEFQPQSKGFGWKWVKFRNAVNSTFIPKLVTMVNISKTILLLHILLSCNCDQWKWAWRRSRPAWVKWGVLEPDIPLLCFLLLKQNVVWESPLFLL